MTYNERKRENDLRRRKKESSLATKGRRATTPEQLLTHPQRQMRLNEGGGRIGEGGLKNPKATPTDIFRR